MILSSSVSLGKYNTKNMFDDVILFLILFLFVLYPYHKYVDVAKPKKRER